MEDFDGVIIMATNFKQNIDNAFLRRISYIIHFPFPNAEQRLQLWKSVFPKKAPLSDEIDFQFLAEHFEMSGAMIKNTALSAAFLAAEENRPITMSELLRAAKKQFEKFGKHLTSNELGPYADLFR